MGQTEIGCCQKSPNIDKQLLITTQKMKEPSQGGDVYKRALYQSRFLQSNKLQDIFKRQKVAVPVLNHEVSSRIESLPPLKISQATYEKGVLEPDYYRFDNTGIVYMGEWKDKVPHGYGRNYYPNENYYEGTFEQGVPHGYGRFISQHGTLYEGQIKHGRANGAGIYEDKQTSYRGQFKDNRKHGKGVEKGINSFFQGTFSYDDKVQGILKYGNSTYEGEFFENMYNGKGKLTNEKGIYSGSFKDGVQHGYGQYSWVDGSIYRGFFKRGTRNGEGEYFNAKNSSIARGIWKDGILNGAGEYLQPNGTKHKCIWQNSKIASLIQ